MESDNYFYKFGCPGIMNYSTYTSYIPNQTLIDAIKQANGFVDPTKYDENDFRAFLQDNGASMMTQENKFFRQNYMCKFPKTRQPIRIMLPYQL